MNHDDPIIGTASGRLAFGLATGLVSVGPGIGLALSRLDDDRYFRCVQEDGTLEWATFFCFLAAGLIFLFLALRKDGRVPWFPIAVAGFCWFVAGEEISWGQRILGLAPPPFLVEHNVQQELSLHNLTGVRIHDLAFITIVLGYGILLPFGTLVPAVRRRMERLGLRTAPVGLIPAFGALLVIHFVADVWYLEEWTELGLGVAFFCAGVFQTRVARPTLVLIIAGAILTGLGALASTATGTARVGDPEREIHVRAELDALRQDLRTGQLELSCELHKRMRDYHRVTGHLALGSGAFRRVASERGTVPGEHYLDPWHMPYWIVARCPEGDSERSVLVYSTGPNRRRDSTRWSIEGDDLAAEVLGPDRTIRSGRATH